MEEAEAIARLKRGDISGLEALVQRYQAEGVRVAYLVCHDHALAEDLMQAAFLRVYERIDQFDAHRPFGPWFLRLILNDAIRASHQRARQVPLAPANDAHELVSRQPGPEELAENAEQHAAVRAMLAALNPEQRAVIVQRYYLEMTEAEMASALHCAPGTIKSRLHYARQRLRQLLAPWFEWSAAAPLSGDSRGPAVAPQTKGDP